MPVKYTKFAIFLVVLLLIAAVFTWLSKPEVQLEHTMMDYCRAMEGDLPEDLRLTVYYIDFGILTYMPLSAEDLMDLSIVTKIVVTAKELAAYQELLKYLEPSALKPAIEKQYVNARMYYVFETESTGKLLEVTISDMNRNVIVNGIEVMNDPLFFALIEPFLDKDKIPW